MGTTITKLEKIRSKATGYWDNRICAQLAYAVEMFKAENLKIDMVISDAIDILYKESVEFGTVTKKTSMQAEKIITKLTEKAKKYKMICVAHAHIDMNWMWDYAETVAITLDTFRTILNIMDEYPEFKFSQSQASVYKIVEEYDPLMLEEIKKRVKEGRWEVTASTWVETDKNMPNGESLSRHILYTKKYLSNLLRIHSDTLNLDFEPDTFGHNQNVPEILQNGGVDFYYHCRGYDGHIVYRWEAPSGKSVIVYREPNWYNSEINAEIAFSVPKFCLEYGINIALRVYGVGDHGGGPTRKDIERIKDMSTWPVFPNMTFGTFAEFFKKLNSISETLPVRKGELNFIFTGCYTTQTRIKTANRISEVKLNEAEAFSTISTLFAKGKYNKEAFIVAWEKTLFNQFHDIIPGSGIIDTREYAMGEFQKVLAITNTESVSALRNIAEKIDTSHMIKCEEDHMNTVSEGGGVGYAIKDFELPQTERGKGIQRIYHFFNPSSHDRNEPVNIVLWDWEGDIERIKITDECGNKVIFQILDNDINLHCNKAYWGHKYFKILIDVKVPAYGYSTYLLDQEEDIELIEHVVSFPRVETIDHYVLENEYIKVVFDTNTAAITTLIDKTNGKKMIDPSKPAGIFRLVEEDDSKGMTAWIIGRYIGVFDLIDRVKIKKIHMGENNLRQWISYEVAFRKSKLIVTVTLDYNSSMICYDVECDWQEVAKVGSYIPQLNFHLPLSYKCKKYKYDIPFGSIERDALNMDVPGNSWVAGIPVEGERGVMIISASKYGFRSFDNSLALTLIRSSYDPDPYPEFGMHNFKFAVNVSGCSSNKKLINDAYDYNHPLHFVSGTLHKGELPYIKSFICVEKGSVVVSAIKMPEDNNVSNAMIIRLYETDGSDTNAILRFTESPNKAYFVDINENTNNILNTIIIDKKTISFRVDSYCLANICVEF